MAQIRSAGWFVENRFAAKGRKIMGVGPAVTGVCADAAIEWAALVELRT
jgi:hypothetical protein